jgi:hypothetical protein
MDDGTTGFPKKPATNEHDDTQTVTITALVRSATDEHGNGPSAGAIRTYVADGVLPAVRDTTGRLLFRRSDARIALQIYQARKARHGKTGRRTSAD